MIHVGIDGYGDFVISSEENSVKISINFVWYVRDLQINNSCVIWRRKTFLEKKFSKGMDYEKFKSRSMCGYIYWDYFDTRNIRLWQNRFGIGAGNTGSLRCRCGGRRRDIGGCCRGGGSGPGGCVRVCSGAASVSGRGSVRDLSALAGSGRKAHAFVSERNICPNQPGATSIARWRERGHPGPRSPPG